MKSQAQHKSGAAVLGPILLFFSVILLHQYRNDIWGAIFTSPAQFRKVGGTIIHSSMHYIGGKRPGYGYSIEYKYTVDGKEYRSNQVTFASKVADREKEFAQAYVGRYPVGEIVDVYYKPHEPSFAVLEPTQKGDTIEIFILLVIMMMFSLSMIWWAYGSGKVRWPRGNSVTHTSSP